MRVTILKDKDQRKSRGVAFVLFLARDSAYACVQALNNTEMFGRTLRVSIAKDNGRATEFIRRREYKDKSRCYECGEDGHLSYRCPKNLLGDRQPPVKKRKHKDGEEELTTESDNSDDEATKPEQDSFTRMLQYKDKISSASAQSTSREETVNRKKYKKNAYFSDEEELDD